MAKSKGEEAKVDAAAGAPPAEESLREIAARSTSPVVPVARVIPQVKPPEEKPPGLMPDVVLKTEVIWGELPKDPPPKPVKDAVVATTVVMGSAAPPAKRPPSIGSMQPPGK